MSAPRTLGELRAAVARVLVARGESADALRLRPYQTAAALRVLDEVDAGHRRVLLVAPTGSGKTIMFSALAAAFHREGLRVLVVAHRKELLDQSAAKLRAAGVDGVAVYRGGKARPASSVVVASIQALRAGMFAADLVVIDEAHHAPADSYARLLEMYPNAVHVGATATPWWGAGKGLGDYFQAAVVAETVRGLIDLGHLARARVFTHPHTLRDLDLRGVKSQGGDYATAALSERVDRPALLGDIVEHWQTHAGGTRTLCFAASVGHSRHIVARFCAAGIAAEHLDGKTPAVERAAILARLESGATLIVSNFNVLTEGFDAPTVGCVILARPTKRAAVYLQAVGRGMRAVEGKGAFVVLDHGGACLMHGLPDREREVRLAGIEPSRGGGLPARRCPACGLMVPLSAMTCPECSTELRGMVPTEEPTGVLVEIMSTERGLVLTFGERSMSVPDWSAELGVAEETIRGRLKRGLPIEQVLGPRMRNRSSVGLLTVDGVSRTPAEWAKINGLTPGSVYRRIREGKSPQDCVSVPSPESRSAKAVERIAADTQQGRETRKSPIRLTVDGLELTAGQWARRNGTNKYTIITRYRRGLPHEECVKPTAPGVVRGRPPRRQAEDGARAALAAAREAGE